MPCAHHHALTACRSSPAGSSPSAGSPAVRLELVANHVWHQLLLQPLDLLVGRQHSLERGGVEHIHLRAYREVRGTLQRLGPRGREFWCGLRCTRDHAAQTGSQTQRQYAAQGASGSTAQAPCLHVHQVCADLDVGEAPQEGGWQQQVLDSVGGVHIQRQSVAVGQACRGPKEVGEGPYCWVARAGARNCAGLVLPGYHGQRRRGRAGSSCQGTSLQDSWDSRHAHAGLTPCDQPTELASTACP